MNTTCDIAAQEVGSGVAAALTAVDCIAGQVSEQAFGRLFGADGQMAIILTMLLIFYVAFLGIGLMLGRASLSVRALVPRMMTLGLVLTFATSFAAFSTVFYNLFVLGPDWVAGVLTGTDGSATTTFATKLDIVFIAVQEASNGQSDINMFSPPGMMWFGAMLLLLGTVGLLVTARIGLALLLAVGPIFVVLALFNGTRGLFVGWLKGLVMLALVPIFAVVGGSIMLEMAVPILASLVAIPGQIDQQAAMAFFVVGFVHCMLMLMALIVSALMVGKWQVFGFAGIEENARSDQAQPASAPAPALQPAPDRTLAAAPAASAAASQRRADIAPVSAPYAANDTGTGTVTSVRETKVYAAGSPGAQAQGTNGASSRTRGIGNRFRSAGTGSAQSARAPSAPQTETPQ